MVVLRDFSLEALRGLLQSLHRGAHQVQELLMVYPACCRYHDSLGVKGAGEIVHYLFSVCVRHRIDRPVDGQPQRIVLPIHLLKEDMDVVVRCILYHSNLLKDHLLFALDLLRCEYRIAKDVGEYIHHDGEVCVQDLCMYAYVLFGCEGIGEPADRIELLRYIESTAALGPLEEHVLYKVGDAPLILLFVTRSHAHPNPGGNRMNVRQLFSEHTYTIAKDRLFVQSSTSHKE
jgi:hypothetical protein